MPDSCRRCVTYSKMMRTFACLSLGLVLVMPAVAGAKTATEHLRDAPKPVFSDGHSLLPLTRWGWGLSFDARVHIAEQWGYALALGRLNHNNVGQLEDSESQLSRLVALAAESPETYPLSVLLARPLNDKSFRNELPDSLWLRDEQGNVLDVRPYKRYSPEAPTRIFERVAERAVEPLKKLRERAPISVVLNGGEYGLSVAGHIAEHAKKDPRVMKAKGDQSWFAYLGQQKARQEMPITRAVRELLPDRDLYLWYHFGGMPAWQGESWGYQYEPMRNVADLPGQSLYYKHFNDGWTGKNDLLTNFLKSVAICKRFDDPHSYNWVCSGWKEDQFSDHDRYMGYLKCLYTAGQVGAVAGYFSHPDPGFRDDLGSDIPHWLRQMMLLSRAHALFSHLDSFIRDGELLPGPSKHALDDTLPAYEFPTGDETARVLVRKHKDNDADGGKWLLTAWAAAGEAREVTVDVPTLGELTLEARPAGSVYVATRTHKMKYEPPQREIRRVDENAMRPSAGFADAANETSANAE